jgi:hypothetical protein
MPSARSTPSTRLTGANSLSGDLYVPEKQSYAAALCDTYGSTNTSSLVMEGTRA